MAKKGVNRNQGKDPGGARVRAAKNSGLFAPGDLKGFGTFHQRLIRAERKMTAAQAAKTQRIAQKFVKNVDQYRPKPNRTPIVPPPTPGDGKKKRTPFVGPPLPATKKKSGGKFVPPPVK
jgi:hypothetical protein